MPDQANLYIRKMAGKAKNIRYLRCRCCQEEFSERRNTALWRSKIKEEDAVSIAEHLSEGNGIRSTARLTRHDPSTVRRLNKRLGKHAQAFHDEQAVELDVENLQADERHGFAGTKERLEWETEVIDPKSKFVITHVQGRRDEAVIRQALTDASSRVINPQRIALFTDGLASYATVFPEVFGQAYVPHRATHLGRPPKVRFRIPRSAAHVQIVKHREGRKLASVEIKYTHGSHKRINHALEDLGYNVPNTSAIERRNGTARSMSFAQKRKTLGFAKRTDSKTAIGHWATTVYNWCRPHRSLRQPLDVPDGKKLYRQQSPAMAIGLANHIFSHAEIMVTSVYPAGGWR